METLLDNKAMSVVKVTRKFQVTIPLDVRDEIPLNIGDILEAKAQDGQIVFTPKTVVDKSEIKNQIDEIFNSLPTSNQNDDEVMEEAISEINKYRKEKNT